MKRRTFLTKSTIAAALPFVSPAVYGIPRDESQPVFNLDFAPHFGMFENSAGKDLIDQLQFMWEMGFRSMEDNDMRIRPIEVQKQIGEKMASLGMRMGVFVAHTISWNKPNLVTGKKLHQDEFLEEIRNSVETAKRVNAKWMTVVPGHIDLGLEEGYQTANLVDLLRKACEILEPHGLVIVVESLNHWANHPGQFLTKIPQAYEICRAVDSPSCKILFDLYHQQVTEGNLIPNIDLAWDEIGYFQIGDNPGRKEPGTGEINYRNVFKHLHSKGYKGILGMEHGNSISGKDGENAVIEAYRKADDYIK